LQMWSGRAVSAVIPAKGPDGMLSEGTKNGTYGRSRP